MPITVLDAGMQQLPKYAKILALLKLRFWNEEKCSLKKN